MKAQVNKSQTLKNQTYKVTLFSLLLLSSVLFFTASGENYGQHTFLNNIETYGEYLNPDNGYYKVTGFATDKSDDPRGHTNLDYIASLEACCSNHVKQELEVEKMEKFVETNEVAYYQHILAEFNDIEETEWTTAKVSTHVEYHEVQLNDISDNQVADDVSEYLKEMYEQKNRKILEEIETEWQFENYLEVEMEDDMVVEAWMTNEKKWTVTENVYLPAYTIEKATEESLELEDWMLNEANFAGNFTIEEAVESPMEVEDWMKDETYFAVPSISLEVEIEEALEIESWMLNTENFNAENENVDFTHVKDYKLELEPWMTDNKVWEN